MTATFIVQSPIETPTLDRREQHGGAFANVNLIGPFESDEEAIEFTEAAIGKGLVTEYTREFLFHAEELVHTINVEVFD